MNTPKVNRIVCPVDVEFSATSIVAARMAVRLAHITNASVTFVFVVRVPGSVDGIIINGNSKPEFTDGNRSTANSPLLKDSASDRADGIEVPEPNSHDSQIENIQRELLGKIDEIRSRIPDVNYSMEIRSGDVGKQIIEAVDTHDADMICMATRRGSAIARSVLGSVTDHVVRSSQVPVLLMHPGGTARRDDHYFENWPSAIVVPLDGSRLGETAIPLAVLLAKTCGIPIRLVHGESLDEQTPFMAEASESPFWPADGASVMSAAQHYMDSVRNGIATDTVECTSSVVDLSSTRAIIDACRREEHPLIVMSSQGRSGIKRLVLGSVSGEVIRNSGQPVIVIPPERR